MIGLRRLDPGRVRLHAAVRTIVAAALALLASDAVCRSADLPGGMVVIATVVAVLVSRSLHATSLAHRLSALLYVPAIGVAAAFVGRTMLHHPWLGSALFVAGVGTSRYLMRFGGKVRRYGRLALTPLISVLVVPVPSSAAQATGPLWGGVAGLIAVTCVVVVQAALPVRPARQAAAAAVDFTRAAARPAALPPHAPARTAAARTLHRIALTVEDRLDAARLPGSAPRTALDALADAVLKAEVLATTTPTRTPTTTPAPTAGETPAHTAAGADPLAVALTEVRRQAAAVRRLPAAERPTPDVPAPERRARGRFDPQPQTRLAVQLAVAMAAAFAVGHLLFPRHWAWTVITAFVVCSAARSRGDVVHRSGLRILGAFVGALSGTLIAHTVAGHAAVAVPLIFCYLLLGLWLRDLTYAAWAFCVTGLLSVLYGLNGERGSALLLQRPEGILAGSACAVAAACFVLPLRTETLLRGRTARALRVLQDLLAAARAPEPRPTALRRLSRRFDQAVRDLTDAAAPARAHRMLLRAAARRKAAPHTADWPDSVAACADAARALAAADTADLVAAGRPLGLTALNLGQVRRRLGHRPDAAPPRLSGAGPAALIQLNAVLARLYEELPAPSPSAPSPAPPAPPGPPVSEAPAPAAG
ncbi:FUSC family protein [Streptomyces sp. V4-01]|uniref:FUSC family protein n=1 Tax=Actinacidiphila polyblastidii TaxID=3110430 RepID=A0ABU7PJR7_9ACTN|nr:FUSC family protein [Streptomyces sp. V4-01]